MKRLFFLSFLTLLSIGVSAQRNKKPAGSEEEPVKTEKPAKGNSSKGSMAPQGSDRKHLDLMAYYMDGDYEKCYKKSVKVTEDEETSKDALPYLYASMCLYEMSFLEQYASAYPEGIKESLKWAGKYRKKDEKNSQKQGLNYLEFWEENEAFFGKLRKTAKDSANAQLDLGKQSKAEQIYKLILAVEPDDYSVNYMMYTMRTEANDAVNGDKYLQTFKDQVAKLDGFSGEPKDRIEMLKYAHVEYAKYLVSNNRSDVARQVLDQLTTYIGKDANVESLIEEKKL
ncbi:MAG: hypothetical protein V4616_08910 [Bacteroidota bacterium]